MADKAKKEKSTSTPFAKAMGTLACGQCDSELVMNKTDGLLHHDQYARDKNTKQILEDQPLDCPWAGTRYEVPTVELKQAG